MCVYLYMSIYINIYTHIFYTHYSVHKRHRYVFNWTVVQNKQVYIYIYIKYKKFLGCFPLAERYRWWSLALTSHFMQLQVKSSRKTKMSIQKEKKQNSEAKKKRSVVVFRSVFFFFFFFWNILFIPFSTETPFSPKSCGGRRFRTSRVSEKKSGTVHQKVKWPIHVFIEN